MKSITEGQVASWAKKIAGEFIAGGDDNLQDRVLRLVRAEGLNPEQSRRVSEATNIATYNAKLPDRGSEEDVRFDLADPKGVVDAMNAPETVSEDNPADYQGAPPVQKAAASSISAVPSRFIESEMSKMAMEKTAAGKPHVNLASLQDAVGKLKFAAENYRLQQVEFGRLERQERAKLAEIVRQLSFTYKPEELYKAAVAMRPNQKEKIAEFFGEIFSDLAKRGYIKIGSHMKVGRALPAEMISKKLKEMSPGVEVEVINGVNPVFLSIDTLTDIQESKEKAEAGEGIAKDRLAKAKRVITDIGGLRRAQPKGANE
jgi:hypothetical protein